MKGLLLIALLGLVACNGKFEGKFVANESVDVIKGSNLLTIETGTYEATAKLRKKSVTLKLDNGEETLKFKLKSSALRPQANGEIQATATELGQAFGAAGTLKQNVSLSELKEGTERCQMNIGTCGGPYSGPRGPYYVDGIYPGSYSCGMTGHRDVRYKVKSTTQNLLLNLVQDSNLVASLKAKEVKEVRVYEFMGHCHF